MPAMRTRLAAVSLALAAPCSAQVTGLSFTTGVDAYLEVAPAAPLVPRSGITVEAWVTYQDATLPPGIAWPTIVRQNLTPASESFFLRVDAGSASATVLRFKVVTSTGLQLSARWTFSPGQMTAWTHVAGTYDGTTARLFVNGAEVGQAAGAGTIRDLGGTLRIGKGDDATPGHGEVWNGEIDEVRLWPFARTAAEIQASMQQELGSVPGRVCTWNLNGNALDTSLGLHGTLMGTPVFAPNNLNLAIFAPPGVQPYGTSTTTCTTAPDLTITCVPRVGNAAFGLAGTGGPTNGSGTLLLGARPLPVPIVFLGASVWVDPSAPMVLVPVAGSALGTAKVPLPVPSSSSLTRAPLVAQLLWADACGPVGLSATTGLGIGILP